MKIKHRRRMPRLDSARNHLWHQVIAVIKLHNGQVTLVELSFVLFRDVDLLNLVRIEEDIEDFASLAL